MARRSRRQWVSQPPLRSRCPPDRPLHPTALQVSLRPSLLQNAGRSSSLWDTESVRCTEWQHNLPTSRLNVGYQSDTWINLLLVVPTSSLGRNPPVTNPITRVPPSHGVAFMPIGKIRKTQAVSSAQTWQLACGRSPTPAHRGVDSCFPVRFHRCLMIRQHCDPHTTRL